MSHGGASAGSALSLDVDYQLVLEHAHEGTGRSRRRSNSFSTQRHASPLPTLSRETRAQANWATLRCAVCCAGRLRRARPVVRRAAAPVGPLRPFGRALRRRRCRLGRRRPEDGHLFAPRFDCHLSAQAQERAGAQRVAPLPWRAGAAAAGGGAEPRGAQAVLWGSRAHVPRSHPQRAASIHSESIKRAEGAVEAVATALGVQRTASKRLSHLSDRKVSNVSERSVTITDEQLAGA